MKREHLLLEQLSESQLQHTKNLVQREISRREHEQQVPGRVRKANQSGQHRAVRTAKKA
jgi:hypothetical protein